MKPGITPYDRNSRLGLKMLTVNPCNQFIIESLLRWKIKVQKQGLNQYYTYNLAVQAVRKYPLPILCYQQMKVMEGFGKFFCTSVAKLVRNHYQRGRLPTQQQKDSDDKQHQQFLRRQMRKMRHQLKKSNPDGGQDEQQNQGSDNQSQYSEFNDNFDSQFQDQDQDADDNQSCMSQSSDASSKSIRSYKPKAGSQYYNFLKAFSGVLSQRPKDGSTKPVSRAEINTQLYNWKMDKVRQWNKITDKLKQAGFIKIDPKDQDFLTITTKGKDFLVQMQEQEKTKFNENTNIIIFRKQKLQTCQGLDKLVLLANTRGSYKAEQQFMITLASDDKSKVKQAQYELSSFTWMLNQKILDYMIMRFKLESFDIEQFTDICIRARNSTCNHVFVIFEAPIQKNRKLAITKDQLDKLSSQCRASGFKVLKYVGFLDTIKFLREATKQIQKKISQIPQGQQVLMLGTLQIYNQQNKKLLPICLKQVSRKMLQCIPRMSRDTIEVILQKLPSFVVAHNYMLRLNDSQQRIRFLMWMLKDFKYKIGTLQCLDDLLFRTSYEFQDEQQQT